MSVEVRTLAEGELEDFLRAETPAWGYAARPDELEGSRHLLEVDRVVVASDGPLIVGGSAMLSQRLTLPGGRVRMGGLTYVFVRPTHRRQGLLRRMVLEQLSRARDAGEPLSGLYASESSIYRRFGYGTAMQVVNAEIERARAALLPGGPAPLAAAGPAPGAGRMELVDEEAARRLLPPLFETVAASTNGCWDRPAGWWEAIFMLGREGRDGLGPVQIVVRHGPTGVDGFARYRMGVNFDEHLANARLDVQDLAATTPDAELDLWRYLLALDLVGPVSAHLRPVDEPLLHRLADPRRLRRTLRDGLHIRILDVAACLGARRYAREDAVTVRVVDPVGGFAEGTFRVEGGFEGASCTPSSAAPDLVLDAAALGSALLGEVSVELLHRAGWVEEQTPGAVGRAAAMFAWTPRPWAPGIF